MRCAASQKMTAFVHFLRSGICEFRAFEDRHQYVEIFASFSLRLCALAVEHVKL